MTFLKFNPRTYRGRKTVEVKILGYQGIRAIWDWSESKEEYVKRAVGLRFAASKKIQGVQRAKFFESFEDAKAWRASPYLFETALGGDVPLFSKVMAQFFEHHKKKWRVTTFETYTANSKNLKFFESLPMNQITPKAVDEWLRVMKTDASLSQMHKTRQTFRHELGLLKQICGYYSEYHDDKYLIPCKRRHNEDAIIDPVAYKLNQSKAKYRFITDNDKAAFLSALMERARANPERGVYYLLAMFQLRTGCRVGEACALEFGDLDLEQGLCIITKTVHWTRFKGRETLISPLTKTGEQRKIFLTHDLINLLRSWSQHKDRSQGLIFSYDGTSILSYRSIQFQYNSAFGAAGLEWSSTHILRHTFATDFMERNGNQNALKSQLGHRTILQTEHYGKTSESVARAAIEAYGIALEAKEERPSISFLGSQTEVEKRGEAV